MGGFRRECRLGALSDIPIDQRQWQLSANPVEKLHFHRGQDNLRAIQEQLQFLAEGAAKNSLLPCGIR